MEYVFYIIGILILFLGLMGGLLWLVVSVVTFLFFAETFGFIDYENGTWKTYRNLEYLKLEESSERGSRKT